MRAQDELEKLAGLEGGSEGEVESHKVLQVRLLMVIVHVLQALHTVCQDVANKNSQLYQVFALLQSHEFMQPGNRFIDFSVTLESIVCTCNSTICA